MHSEKNRSVLLITPRGNLKMVIRILCVLIFSISAAQAITGFTYQQVSCSSSQYYDTSQLQCVSCPTNTTGSGFNCVCKSGFYYVSNFGGGQVVCSPCPSGQVTSTDGWSCVACSATISNAACTCSAAEQGSLLTYRDIFGNAQASGTTCSACATGTQLSTDGSHCVACGQTLNIQGGTMCNCTNPVGGFCFPSTLTSGTTADTAVYKSNRQSATNPSVSSAWFANNVQAAYIMCSNYRNTTACQSLGNMCTLLFASRQNAGSSSGVKDACYYFQLAQTAGSTGVNGITNWDQYMPWIWYDSSQLVSNFLFDTAFTQTISLSQYIDIRFAVYSLNGTFLGFSMINSSIAQLCPGTVSETNAGFYFGTYYNQSCYVYVDDLFNETMVFLDPYLYYTQNGQGALYPIPVLITNYYASSSYPNTAAYPTYTNWQLTRRFFMVDNVAPISTSSTTQTPTFVTYASSINLQFQLISGTTTGQFYPPLLTVTYSDVDSTSYGQFQTVPASFSITYYNDPAAFEYQFSIAIGVMSAVAGLWAIMRTWSWSKRAGKSSVDAVAILKFFAFACSYLANMFFIVSAGTAMYLTVFYKRQTTMALAMPTTSLQSYILAFLYAAFALKFVDLIHLIAAQCTIDVFLIDWEKNRNAKKHIPTIANPSARNEDKKLSDPPLSEVSIWRSTFIANEFSELQLYRKINVKLQLFVVLLALETIGFINVGTLDGYGNLSLASTGTYQTPFSPVFRYALISVVWIVWGVIQWAFKSFVYERIIEDRMGMFTDLCSVANVSVFIMSSRQFGYYIHGRSAHGYSDTNLKEMVEQLAKEEQGLVGHRGLVAGDDIQVFLMYLPASLRPTIDQCYAEISSRVVDNNRGGSETAAQTGITVVTPQQMKRFQAYQRLNGYLQSFIDHSISRAADYDVRKRKFIEYVLDIETDTLIGNKGYFYPDIDGNGFDAILFHGSEWTLFIFDLLLFCFVDALAGMQNVALDVFITYVASQFYQLARSELGKKNIAKKTLIDSRFLA